MTRDAHWWEWNPLGPIFGKELRVTSRRKRTYLMRSIYLGALLVFLMIVYKDAGHGGGGVAERMQQQTRLSRDFFMVYSVFSVMAVGILGQVFTCGAISAERMHKTLDVLLMTPINTFQLLIGKLFSRMLALLTLLGLTIPVLALVRLLGGVELSQMAAVICLCICFALSSAAVGLLFSTLYKNTAAVLVLSFGAQIIVYWAISAAIEINVAGRASEQWIALINPIFMVVIEADGSSLGKFNWTTTALIQLGLTAALLALSALTLRRQARRSHEGVMSIRASLRMQAETASRPALRAAPPLVGAAMGPPAIEPPQDGGAAGATRWRGRRAASEVSDNPVLWRELRRGVARGRAQRIIMLIALAGLLGLTYMLADDHGLLYREVDAQYPYTAIFNFIFGAAVVVLAAVSFTQEKESDTWTLLLTTPLSGAAIVRGKALGVSRRVSMLAALMALHYLFFMVVGPVDLYAAFIAMWTLVTFSSIWLAVGLFLSLTMKRTVSALMLTLLAALLFYGGIPLLIFWATEGRSQITAVASTRYYMAPYYGISALQLREHSFGWRESIDGWTPAQFLALAIAVGLGYLTVSLAILAATAAKFDRIVKRAVG